MQCEEVRDQFTDYLIEVLPEAKRSVLQQHLIGCASCRVEVEGLKAIWAKLGSIPSEEPGPAMRARFDVMLEAYKHGLDHAPTTSWWRSMNTWMSGWWPSQPVLQFGLSAALLLIGIAIGQQYRQPAQGDGEITELRSELRDMRNVIAISLLQQQSASERLKGVSWSYQIAQPNNDFLATLLDTLKHDAAVNVRLAAVDALRQFGDREVVRRGIIEALTQQASPLVQMELIKVLVELREKSSVAALRQVFADPATNEDVRRRAEWGIEQLE